MKRMDIHRREEMRTLEEDIGYLFEEPALLLQALVHTSERQGLPAAHSGRNDRAVQ